MRLKDLEYRYFRKVRNYKGRYAKARYAGRITNTKIVRALGLAFLLFSTLFTTGSSSGEVYEKPQPQREESNPFLGAETSRQEERPLPQIPIKLADSPEFGPITARSALVIDVKSGTVLYQKEQDLPLPPASITKVMTALLVLDSFKLDEVVVVQKNCTQLAGNNFGFFGGEKATVEELLFLMLVGSDSDATCALSLHKTSLSEFVLVMNAKAKVLGLDKTYFMNPIGLHEENHNSTASDIIKLAREALKNDKFKEIVGTKTIDIKGKKVINTNDLLFELSSVTGIKTGYTSEAGGCILVSANQGDQEILAVLLGSEERFKEMRSLIDWIYRVYKWPPPEPT